MNVILDEDTPIQVLAPLKHLLAPHAVTHVESVRWKGKLDRNLIPDAARRGYDVIVTKDSGQLLDPQECRLIRRSKLHHVRFSQGKGIAELARAVASVIAAMPDVMSDLEAADSQRIVKINSVARRGRYDIANSRWDPPS